LRNLKYLENVLENFIKSVLNNETNRDDRAMFKVYLNNPNYFVKQEDVLANLCMEGSTDVIRMCNSLGVHVSRPEKLTFGQLLRKCNIL
jgi:hypothetical protein